MRRITIKDIAKACGVSINTVSRAINDKADVSSKTKLMVLKHIEEVGFVPNYNARGMSSNKRFLIGLIYDMSFQISNFKIIVNILEQAQLKGYGTVCQTVMGDKKRKFDECKKIIDNICVYNLEGLIIDASVIRGFETEIISLVSKRNIPLVVINLNEKFENCNVILKHSGKASYLLTLHLLDKGYDAVAYIGWAQNSGKVNFDGYLRALNKKGIDFSNKLLVDTFNYGNNDIAKMRAIENTVFSLNRKYKRIAFYCTTVLLAGLAEKAALKAGMNIPWEITFAGLEEEAMNNALLHPVICCKTNYKKIASKGIEFVMRSRKTGKCYFYDAKWEIS